MPVDVTDPEVVALLDAAKREAVTPIQSALNEAAKNLAARDSALAQLTAKATAAEAALASAMESGTATAAEIAALRAKVEAADAREAAAAKAATDARIAALPEPMRAGAPDDPAALTVWLEAREAAAAAIPRVPPATNGGGGVHTDAPTDADLDFARSRGFGDATPENVIKLSTKFGPRARKSA